ncbi:MAG: hypothetical protein ABIG63_03775 [Chloroflexota bacterium]
MPRARNPFANQDEQLAPESTPASGLAQPQAAPWGSLDAAKIQPEPDQRSHITSIPTADWQPKKRKKDTRQRAKSRWLSLLPENKQRIKKYTDALNVPEYELVRYLLEYGLDQVANGYLIFESHLDQTGLTLYPNEQRPRKSRKDRLNLVHTTYRGIPDETWDQLKTLARNHPIWQVANKLIEHSLEQLASGQLNPNPQSSGIKTLY